MAAPSTEPLIILHRNSGSDLRWTKVGFKSGINSAQRLTTSIINVLILFFSTNCRIKDHITAIL